MEKAELWTLWILSKVPLTMGAVMKMERRRLDAPGTLCADS
jgi:hypothetical protein